MYKDDWVDINLFKEKIKKLKHQGVIFISLTEALDKIRRDTFRTKKYAVITFDDGYKSLYEILSWLEENKIPVTLFINGKYLDGKSYRENPEEEYLTKEDLFKLTSKYIEIGHHGWEHTPINKMSKNEILESLNKNIKVLEKHPRYIPYWAYTYGIYTKESDSILKENNINLVKVDFKKNYHYRGYIDREPF